MKAILTYHSVDETGSVISVSPATFERHVRWMASGAVDVVPLAELLRLPADRDAVAITFDDGYVNFAEEAWPRLRAHGFPVTLFVPTGFVGRANEWGALPGGGMPRLDILDWHALARLHDEGVTLGAHSRTHADLRALAPAALADEVLGSVEDLQRETGCRPEAFAYPYGFWSPAAASAVGAACRLACTTELRPLGAVEMPHLLPRLDSFYLDGPARIDRFGRLTFRVYLDLRGRIRRLGQRWRDPRSARPADR